MSQAAPLTARQRQVLEFVDAEVRHKGYPPSVREIGDHVGLSSSSTVHAHLAALQDKGYLRRDPSKPRAIEVCFEPGSGAVVDRRPVVHVPLVGDVAAGTGVLAAENIEETMPLPEDLTGTGTLFMLRVRGDSMIEAGIFDRDLLIVDRAEETRHGHVVVVSINEKFLVKRLDKSKPMPVFRSANSNYPDFTPSPGDDVIIWGRVVHSIRQH